VAAGLIEEEEPISVVRRDDGDLADRRPRLDARAAAVILLVIAGLALRAALAYPTHKYMADADSLDAGMRAFHVLQGETPVFFSGTRLGSIEPHLAAAVFLVLGASRDTLALVPLLLGFGLVVVLYNFYRQLFPPNVALIALAFIALPSPAFIAWTYMPNGYPAILFLCGAMLWLGALIGRQGPSRMRVLLFGVAGGLGLWQCFLTLGMLAAVLVWLAWTRPELRRPSRWWWLGAAGFVVGGFPWIAYNVVWPLAAFQGSLPARAAHGWESIVSNLHYFLSYSLGEIVTPVKEAWTQFLADPGVRLHNLLRLPMRILFAAAALVFLAAPALRGRARQEVDQRLGSSTWLLFALVFAAYGLLNVATEPGQTRDYTVRYVLPLYLLVPGVLAVFLSLVAARSRAAALLLAASVVVSNASAYHWPGRSTRVAWRKEAAADDQLVRWLHRRGVTAVLGGYWTSYPINFLSHETILALPCTADYYNYRGRRPPKRLYRWALVSRRPAELESWSTRAGVGGTVELAAPERSVLVLAAAPADPAAQERLITRLVRTCTTQD
jgi:hypothetical protein